MPKNSRMITLEAAIRWTANTMLQKPWVISIEVTHNCTANCEHCDKGEPIPNEKQAAPEEYQIICQRLRPLIVQISGGEPLLRKDILDIIRALKNPGHLPLIVFVTNASLLTEEKYDQLKEAGVDQFSISIDFPDKRHDQNRHVPGLFQHLSDLVPRLSARMNNDLTMITAVTRINYPYLLDILRLATKWGAGLNLSMYTAGRTGNQDLLISSAQDLSSFRKTIDTLIDEKKKGVPVFSSQKVLNRYYRFFEDGAVAGECKAGIRSLIVNPDGSLCPCAMKKHAAFGSLHQLQENFVRINKCSECFISLRANTEKSFGELLKDAWASRARI